MKACEFARYSFQFGAVGSKAVKECAQAALIRDIASRSSSPSRRKLFAVSTSVLTMNGTPLNTH